MRPVHAAIATAILSSWILFAYGVSLDGLRDVNDHVVGRDFLNLHVAGSLINRGEAEILLDPYAYLDALRAMVGDPEYPIHNWSYPPLLLPLAQGLALLPYPVALAVWTVGGALALALSGRMLGLGSGWVWLVLAPPGATICLSAGQNGLYAAALMAGAVGLALRGRDVRASACWTLLAAKPHLGALALPMLLRQRNHRVILATTALLGALVAATIGLYGPDPWVAFFTRTTALQRQVVETWEGAIVFTMPTLFMQGRMLGLPIPTAYLLHGMGALLAVALLLRSLPQRDGNARIWLTWFTLGTFLLLPYSFFYDLVALQLVLALWRDDPEGLFGVADRRLAVALWAAAWLLPYLSVAVALVAGLQIVPLALALMLWRMPRAGAPAHPGTARPAD